MAAVGEVLLEAWKGRWSPLQWSAETRKVIDKNKDKNNIKEKVAEILVQQATFGRTPNALILSYLKHGVTSKLLSYSSAFLAVHQFQNVENHRCLAALLDLLNDIAPQISCHGDETECLRLAFSLVCLVYWLLTSVIRLLKMCLEAVKSPEKGQPEHFLTNVTRGQKVLSLIIENQLYKSLIIVGEMDDQASTKDLDRMLQGHLKDLYTIRSEPFNNTDNIITKAQQHFKELVIQITKLTNLASGSGPCTRMPGRIPNISVQAVVNIQALVHPLNEPELITDLMDTLLRVQNIPGRHYLYVELMRSSLIGLLEASGTTEESLWMCFTFVKLPKVISLLEHRYNPNPSDCTGILTAFQLLLQFVPLLNDVDLKCGFSCYDVLLQQYTKIDPAMGHFSEKMRRNSSHVADENKLTFAETKLHAILKVLENSPMESHELTKHWLGPMFNVVNFKWITAIAVNSDKMSALVMGLIRVTENTKHLHATGEKEDGKSGEARGTLFQMSFLLLCYIAQSYGKRAILDNCSGFENSFVVSWLNNNVFSELCMETSHKSDKSKISNLLDHFLNGKMPRTIHCNWDEMCTNIPPAVMEIVKAQQYDLIVEKIVDHFKHHTPCLVICLCATLCSYIRSLKAEQREKPLKLLQQLVISGMSANPQGFSDRSLISAILYHLTYKTIGKETTMEIVKRCLSGFEDKNIITPSLNQPASQVMSKLLKKAVKNNSIGSKAVQSFKELHATGGAHWFASTVVRGVLDQVRKEEIVQAADIGSCLLLLDQSLVDVLLKQVIPSYLHHSKSKTPLIDPKGFGLARLATHAITFWLVTEQRKRQKELSLERSRPPKSQRLDNSVSMHGEFHLTDTQQALISFCTEMSESLDGVCADAPVSFLKSFLHQAVTCTGNVSSSILNCLPADLASQLLRLVPSPIQPDLLLGLCNLKTTEGRKLCAKSLCDGAFTG